MQNGVQQMCSEDGAGREDGCAGGLASNPPDALEELIGWTGQLPDVLDNVARLQARVSRSEAILNDLIAHILNPISSLGDILSYVERLEKFRGGK